jgi:hypothetical protein
MKFYIAGFILLSILVMLWRWFTREEVDEWLHNTWEFTKLLKHRNPSARLAARFELTRINPCYWTGSTIWKSSVPKWTQQGDPACYRHFRGGHLTVLSLCERRIGRLGL